LYDEISISIEDGDAVNIKTNMKALPLNEENTAYRAARQFFEYKGIKKRHINMTITKRIPVESGMGGASSDAACVLKMLNKLIPAYTKDELYELSKHIGSDVPFFMTDGPGLVRGRGDIVKKVEIRDSLYYVAVKPDFGVSTQWAYSHLKLLTKKELSFMCDLALYTRYDIMRYLKNDLEMVVERYNPEIKIIKEKLLSCGAKAAMMTGSGSCIFGIFYREQDADVAFNKMSEEYTTVYKLRGI